MKITEKMKQTTYSNDGCAYTVNEETILLQEEEITKQDFYQVFMNIALEIINDYNNNSDIAINFGGNTLDLQDMLDTSLITIDDLNNNNEYTSTIIRFELEI